jgi:hypothetical protein
MRLTYNLFLASVLFLTVLLHGCGNKSALYLSKPLPAAPAPAVPDQSDPAQPNQNQ